MEELQREEELHKKHLQRIQEMKKKKEQQLRLRKIIPVCVVLFVVVVLILFIIFVKKNNGKKQTGQNYVTESSERQEQMEEYLTDTETSQEEEESTQNVLEADNTIDLFKPVSTSSTHGFSSDIISEYGVLIDVEKETILAQKDAKVRMNPASMTKILTVLVAAEHVTNLQDTFTITLDITDYSFVNGCSNVGFEVGEVVTVEDLFYGTVLPSGGDAALGLAIYVAGSHEAFVEMMNDKLQELGIAETTHFTNCVGLYDKEHFSTAYDMAIILKAAADNELCRQFLSAHTFTTSSTAEHPEGITISNWFLRRIEDKDTHGEVLCGKTGYVTQSGNCAASLAVGQDGKEYICVTAKSSSVWKCIADQTILYSRYLP